MTEEKDEAVGNINVFLRPIIKFTYNALEKITSMASAISDINKHVTTREHFQKLSTYEGVNTTRV